MNENILKLLNTDNEFYPVNLEKKFPLLLDKIIQLWGTPEFDSNISKLMLDTRNHMRQGFPPAVASDILRLSLIHTEQHGGHGGTVAKL